MHHGVNAAVYRRFLVAEVRYLRKHLAARRRKRLTHQLGNALALRRHNRNHRYAQRLAHLPHVDGAAVGAHLVHHVQRQHHRHAQLQKLQRQIQVALDVRRVHDVDDAVRLLVENEISGYDFLLRIGSERIDARQVNDRAALFPANLAHLLIDRHARKIAHVLIRAGERVEQRRLSAVLVADKRKNHFPSTSTSIFSASSTRSVSS